MLEINKLGRYSDEEVQEAINELQEMAREDQEYYDRNGWGNDRGMTRRDIFYEMQMAKMYEVLRRLEQWDDSYEPNGRFVKRLVKVNRYLPEHCKAYDIDYFLFAGLWMELEVFILPLAKLKDTGKVFQPVVKKYGKSRNLKTVKIYKFPSDPVSVGLPSSDEVMYHTFQEIPGTSYGICISCRGKQKWMKDENFFRSCWNWEYLKVED